MVRTRFAPSPTGLLHIGNLRSAVYPYAMAKHEDGRFVLRIEDTDQKRYKPEGIEDIKKTLAAFGLSWDEYYVQSQRKAEGIYQKSAEKLLASGHAFFCNCSAKNAKDVGYSSVLRDPCRDKNLTSGAIKLKVPDNDRVTYFDFVLKKEVSWDTNTVYDATLLKSDGFPTYHLAAMTDDLDMEITHIIRGHDWMPSTPIHLLVFRYLGGHQPQIGHLTDILSPKGGKLSKRKDSVFCQTFINEGYLPEALLNFVILLGWAPKDNRDLFTLDEFVKHFDPKGFQKANPMFLPAKLDWFNGHYLRQKTDTEIVQLVKPYMKTNLPDNTLTQLVPLVKDRMTKLSDINPLTDFLTDYKLPDPGLFTDRELSRQHLSHALSWINNHAFNFADLSRGWTDEIKTAGWKVGDYFMSLRIAVCGSRSTPPITETMLVLGRQLSLDRITAVSQTLVN